MIDANKKSVILDTDMDTDCDDVGALAVVHALMNRREVELIGVICSAPCEWSAPCVGAINTYFGKPQIPIGILSEEFAAAYDFDEYRSHQTRNSALGNTYNQKIAETYPNHADAVWDGVRLYRSLLASQEDNGVTIIAIGTLTVLAQFLASEPDDISPLSGKELITQKVIRLVTMAEGVYPNGKDGFNWWMDRKSASSVLQDWPGVIVPSPVGRSVETGANLQDSVPEDNPVRVAYEIFLGGPGRNRPSWDQVAVLQAVHPDFGYFLEEPSYALTFDAQTGEHLWSSDGHDTRFVRLIQQASDDELAKEINSLMAAPPS